MGDDWDRFWWCKRCLSLAIVDGGGYNYCDDCGCGDIREGLFERWVELKLLRGEEVLGI